METMQPKFVFKCRKSGFDGYLDDAVILNSKTAEDPSHPINTKLSETNVSPFSYMYQSRLCNFFY